MLQSNQIRRAVTIEDVDLGLHLGPRVRGPRRTRFQEQGCRDRQSGVLFRFLDSFRLLHDE
jgi:hypothetical protein